MGMGHCRQLVILVIAMSVAPWVHGSLTEELLRSANIYLQLRPHDGEAREMPLSDVQQIDSEGDIKVLVHGFIAHRFHNSIAPPFYAYMAQGKHNILLADWSAAASQDFITCRRNLDKVAAFFAELLQSFFEKFEIPLERVHFIGHSLGAHIAGIMGRHFRRQIGRVTGLDPAGPLFRQSDSDSLQPTDALFVDCIHTGHPICGDITLRGRADFFPGGGRVPQHGCSVLASIWSFLHNFSDCSHNMASVFYAESINSPKAFAAVPCLYSAIEMNAPEECFGNTDEANVRKSLVQEAIATERVDVVYMGEHAPHSAAGSYYLDTNFGPPYGRGANTVVP